ncbi:MAG: dihydroneopterin triphosphate diphosphatase [Limnobacter sp.]|uniref:dihydroneopterin triphosphate diphosphatase n=1 Tax=Limnobacter sp. TaxID=2003368 RepID=UPI0022C889B3|nr:dihydroneopterin triphosphate diphosphatase [Limnobacter sp.]MCZ8015025.1 dihydroneopterin triphosphate diphosphatase [Limnobacter sp.]
MSGNKIPVSVLVVMVNPDGEFLLIERADKPGYWQSVTGSLDFPDESPLLAAVRELQEETGFQATPISVPTVCDSHPKDLLVPGLLRPWPHSLQYEIFEHWRHRYPPGVTQNTEHWFMVCVPVDFSPQLASNEHVGFAWLDARQAAERCFSPNNAQAILELANRLQTGQA